MKSHPMEINTNTRVRWEIIRKLPETQSLKGKKVLDIASGLGYFSVQFARLGADVLAADIDQKSLHYLSDNFHISTLPINVEKDTFPDEKFDFIFIGELLEHLQNPLDILRKSKDLLTSEGILVLTVPALEGFFIHSKGKRLGHQDGSEKHERDGFYKYEIEDMLNTVKMELVSHTYSVYFFAELFMQLTKLVYIKNKKTYASQSDVFTVTGNIKYKILKYIYPVLLLGFNIEQFVCRKLRLKGHCHIFVARRKQGIAEKD